MANKQCVTRLQKEYRALLKEPVPQITTHPSPSNLLEWHYVLEGTKGTEYEGGVYHGKVVFPPQYPFKPPSISMFTPSGRFAVNTKLCLSMTDFHPESWNPMWSVGTILTGLLSFMCDTQATTGSITTTRAEKEKLAAESLAFNAKNPMFKKLFPEWLERHEAAVALTAATAASSYPLPTHSVRSPASAPPAAPRPPSLPVTSPPAARGIPGAQAGQQEAHPGVGRAAAAAEPGSPLWATGRSKGAETAAVPAAEGAGGSSILMVLVVAIVVVAVAVPFLVLPASRTTPHHQMS